MKDPLFRKLFEPTRLGTVELRNRIVMVPLMTNFADEHGYVTQRLIDYYEERAKGGVGLVIVEAACVEFPLGKGFPRQLAISDDRFERGLGKLVDAIHLHGARVAIQLYHAGSVTSEKLAGAQPVGPSAIRVPSGELTRELSAAEITKEVDTFARAARLARKVGFDGVEIVATGGYLVCEFLSRAWNKRRDEYGGPLENRARFLLDIIRTIKRSSGTEFPVWVRLILEEQGVEGGITLDETVETARMVERAGSAAINTSIYGYGKFSGLLTPEIPGELVPKVELVKKAVSIPVMAVGRLDAEVGERVLEEQRADLIAIGRGLVVDPELPNKAASGRLDDIAPCIGCLHCLETTTFGSDGLHCTVNPAAGVERRFRMTRSMSPKRVVVVGGGPAGMEAARVAALRGHDVSLFEKESELGGQLLLASVPPHKQSIKALPKYMAAQMEKAGVNVELGKTMTSEELDGLRPDALVLATGVRYRVPQITGLERTSAAMAAEVLTGRVQVGRKVVVIGGDLVGPEVAEFLAENGREVTIIEVADRIASRVMPVLRVQLLTRLAEKGVTIMTGIKEERMSEHGIAVTTKGGENLLLEVDTVVLATGAESDTALFQALSGKISELYVAGDCAAPRKIADAILDGARVGLRI